MNRQRALSASAASECENAKHPTCKCRCGGKMHGAARGKISGLPVDDPHSPSALCHKCGGSGKITETDYWAEPNERGEYPRVEKDCRYCDGKGRYIKPAVLRELNKLESVTHQEAVADELRLY